MRKKKDNKNNLLEDQLKRVLADYDNAKKRFEKEREDVYKFANERLILKLLSLYDMLLYAQNHVSDTGLAIVVSEFDNLLKEEGYEKICSKENDTFSPDIHEAVETIEGGEFGKIKESVNLGWKRSIDGFIIRHEKVKVYK